jgi:predicted  nucleic acid-binding Zn-ribbon protein
MELMSLLTVIGGLMLSIIGYFLKKTMDELKEVKELSYDNKSKLQVLQVDYKNKIENITEKFDELKLTLSELIKEIKELNKRIK